MCVLFVPLLPRIMPQMLLIVLNLYATWIIPLILIIKPDQSHKFTWWLKYCRIHYIFILHLPCILLKLPGFNSDSEFLMCFQIFWTPLYISAAWLSELTRDVNCVLHRIVKHTCSSLSSGRQGDVNDALSIKPSHRGALFLVQTSGVLMKIWRHVCTAESESVGIRSRRASTQNWTDIEAHFHPPSVSVY